MSIVITTPTGNIGKRALQQLLKAGADVTVIARNPEKLSAEIRSAVKIHQGSLTDGAFVTKALRGAHAVLWLTPTDFSQVDVAAYHHTLGTIAVTAIKENNISHVVNISSAGAQLENAGPISGLGMVERLLNDAAENTVHLRPGFFMEGFLLDLQAIAKEGSLFYPLPGDKAFPMVATQDIGDVAADLLLNTNWRGHNIRGVHGPTDLTYAEVAQILSDSLGKPVQYTQITSEQAYDAFLSFGVSPSYAKAYVAMYQALAQPGALAEKRTSQTTTPTSLREWSDAVLRPLVVG